MKMEIRDNGSLVLDGYVNVVDRKSKTLRSAQGPFIETIQPGTFNRALEKAGDQVEALFNHRTNHKLGSIAEGNLSLVEDSIGLRARLEVTDEEAVQAAKDGKLQGWSFGFSDAQSTWKNEDGMQHRTISDLTLHEVSLLTIEPAYLATSVEARSEVFMEFRADNTDGTDEAEKKEDPAEEDSESSDEKAKEAEEDPKEESGSKKSENSDNLKNNDASEEDDNKQKEEKRTMIKLPNEKELRQQETEQRGMDQFAGIFKRELRDLNVTANGGAVIPENVAQGIVYKMYEESPIMAMARKFTPVAGSLKIPRENDNISIGFVGEGEDVIEQSYVLEFVELKQKRVGAALSLSEQMINDAGLDMASYAQTLLARRTAKAVEKSMLVGDSVADPKQFNGLVKDANVKFVNNATTGSVVIDDLNSMVTDIHPAFLANGSFIMSRPFFNVVSKMKDAMGHYYVQNGVINGKLTFTLFGAPVYITDVLDAGTTAGDVPAVFGDYSEAVGMLIKKEQGLKEIIDGQQAVRGSRLYVFDFYADSAVINPQAVVKLVIE